MPVLSRKKRSRHPLISCHTDVIDVKGLKRDPYRVCTLCARYAGVVVVVVVWHYTRVERWRKLNYLNCSLALQYLCKKLLL